MKCSQCNHTSRDDAVYCTQCGTPLVRACAKCGLPAQKGDIFCAGCGVRLQTSGTELATVAAPVAGSENAPVVDQNSERVPMESERKNVTVLFADISGFTAMSESLDPEDVTSIMNGCMRKLADVVVRYEGYVDKFIGDCVMAIFGAPVTHENDPELAIRAALDMHREIEEYNKSLAIRLSKPLSLHCGINSGMVIAGGVGSDRKMQYTVMGDTVNLASRLESLSSTGQTFVSGYTYNLTRHLFEFHRHDPIRVKGKKDPVAVYEVMRTKSLREQERRTVDDTVPLVGREQELVTLRKSAAALSKGKGRTVFLISDPGVGKTRVMMEIRAFFKEEEIQIIEGVCRSFSRSTSYYIFGEILQQLFNIDSEDLDEAIATKISENLPLLLQLDPRNLDAEARKAIVFLGAVLGVHLDDRFKVPTDRMEAQEIKINTFRAFSWFFRELAVIKPILLVLEDLHHADNTSIELIAFLFEHLTDASVMLLPIMRPVASHPSSKLPPIARKLLGDRFMELHFQRLSEEECDQMVRHLLQDDKPSQAILELVRSRADGNPLYIEEIIRNLLEEGIVVQESGESRVVRDLTGVTIPSNIQGMIIARIDRLPTELKELLHTAAVIGPVFKNALVQRVIDHPDLDDRLSRLEEMGMLFESKSFPEIEYSFRNIMTQEAIYSTLLHKKRKEIHALVAERIEQLYASRLEDHYEVLAHHCRRAAQPDRAFDYLVKNGLKAKSTYANQDAVSYLTQAIDLASEVENPSIPLKDVYMALAEVQELSGDLRGAMTALNEAIALIDDDLRQGDLLRTIGKIHEKLGSKEKAVEIYASAARLLDNHPHSVEKGMLLTNQSWILNRMGQPDEAIDKANQALKIFEIQDAQDRIALVCNNLGVIYEHKGLLNQALEYNNKSLEIFSGMGNRPQTANLYLSLGFLYSKKGKPEKALGLFDRAHDIMERIGNRFGSGAALLNKGRCLMDLNRYDEAQAALIPALDLHTKLELPSKIVANEIDLATVLIQQNDHQGARRHIQSAYERAREENLTAEQAKASRLEARLRIKEGHNPDYKFEEAVRLFKSIGRNDEAARVSQEHRRFQRLGV
ncbi:MAG: tetratricopeptide repeat protein [Magnetococcales bacterium]|nr:tetratricopeptide repeat protein [Magnetococcales bacterium]